MEYRRAIKVYGYSPLKKVFCDGILYFNIQHYEVIDIIYEKISTDYKGYRKDPVPNTGRCTRYKNYFRNMKTTQERRYLCDYEHYKYSRKRRKNIPNAWDDLYRKDYCNRSWKRYRKQQYNVKVL